MAEKAGPHLFGRALEQPTAAEREQGVADEGDVVGRRRAIEDMAERMPGHVGDLKRRLAQHDRVAATDSTRSSGAMRRTSSGPTISQPVSACIAALPPAWSGCQWVLRIRSSRPQPSRSSSARMAAASGVSTVADGAGRLIAQQEAVVVVQAGEQVDGQGHAGSRA
jgi:hypothetical protein